MEKYGDENRYNDNDDEDYTFDVTFDCFTDDNEESVLQYGDEKVQK